jgi:hypothetical protein
MILFALAFTFAVAALHVVVISLLTTTARAYPYNPMVGSPVTTPAVVHPVHSPKYSVFGTV